MEYLIFSGSIACQVDGPGIN